MQALQANGEGSGALGTQRQKQAEKLIELDAETETSLDGYIEATLDQWITEKGYGFAKAGETTAIMGPR